MKKIIFLFFIFFKAFSNNENYSFRFFGKAIFEVTHESGDILNDVLVTINTKKLIEAGEMLNDCSDIAFSQSLETEVVGLEYFLEGGCNSENTKVWVRTSMQSLGEGTQTAILPISFYYNGHREDENLYFEDSEIYKKTTFPHSILNFVDGICNENYHVLNSDKNIMIRGFNEGTDKLFYGNATHSHTFEAISDNSQGTKISSYSTPTQTTKKVAEMEHVHLIRGSLESIEYLPESLAINFCERDTNSEIDLLPLENSYYLYLPKNLESELTGGWKNFSFFNSSFENRFLVNSKTGKVEKMQNLESHSHKIYYSINSSIISDRYSFPYVDSGIEENCSGAEHNHSSIIQVNPPESDGLLPEYIDVQLIKSENNLDNFIPGIVIPIPAKESIENFEPPIGWERVSLFDGKYVRYGETIGNTGGKKEHVHSISIEIESVDNLDEETCRIVSDLSNPYIQTNYSSSDHKHNKIEVEVTGTNDPLAMNMYFIRRKTSFSVSLKNDSWSENSWECRSLSINDTNVCNLHGKCVADDWCICEDGYIGATCDENITTAFYSSENEIKINYETFIANIEDDGYSGYFFCGKLISNNEGLAIDEGDVLWCVWDTKSLLRTEYLRITNVIPGISQLVIKSLTRDDQFFNISVAPLINEDTNLTGLFTSLGIVGTIFVLVLVILLIIIVIIVIISLMQKRKLKKFDQIKDLDILIAERKTETDDSVAHLNINKKLFEIDYKEIKISTKLGEGGSNSAVFKAKFQGETYAFKCFDTKTFSDKNHFKEFESEVSILSVVNHPYILKFFGASLNPPRVGILMEYCANGDLKKWIKKNPNRLAFSDKLRIFIEVSNAVMFLHSKNIIHRDIKPENVLLTSSMESRLMDFGLSKCVEKSNDAKTKRIGTSNYMSPEVTKGEDYTNKCDTFSMAILMYEVIKEDFNPYGLKTVFQLEFKVSEDPEFRPDLRIDELKNLEWFAKLLNKCWHQDPNKRPDFKELSKILSDEKAKIKENEEDKNEENEDNYEKKKEQLEKQINHFTVENLNLKNQIKELKGEIKSI